MDNAFSDNQQKSRYEYQVGDAIVFANYRRKDGTLYIDYVEAPPELRGSGAAGKLMEYVVSQAKQDELKIIPICGYAASWLKRHPQDA